MSWRRTISSVLSPGRVGLLWLLTTLGIAAFLGLRMTGEDRSVFMPGSVIDGHHQIALACDRCHTPFAGVTQEACLDCHAAELEVARDSHPESKFTDPRNAGFLARLDARRCVTCHVEHRPEITLAMGVTLPGDFCHHCHADVARERPTHQGLSFDTCASSGCHNYHDNRALYEDFLVRHAAGAPDTRPGTVPERKAWISRKRLERVTLTPADVEAPAHSAPGLIDAWAGSAHAAAGVSCGHCHRNGGASWADHPPRQVCRSCHDLEFQGFVGGKHGMRWFVGFDSLSPAQARLPMKPDALSRELQCGTCHDAHAVDVRHAAVDACLSCHADEHSEAYERSPHFRLWRLEASGQGKPGSGVSCATCHLPRERRRVAGAERTVVEHNQNANLRPSEKMIREVCMACHSLALSIDALADEELVRRNFTGSPSRHVPGIDMALSLVPKSPNKREEGSKEP